MGAHMFGAIISPWSYLSLITLAHYLLDREAMPVIFVMNITINRFRNELFYDGEMGGRDL